MHAPEHDDVRTVDLVEYTVRKAPEQHSTHLRKNNLVVQGIALQQVRCCPECAQKLAPEPSLVCDLRKCFRADQEPVAVPGHPSDRSISSMASSSSTASRGFSR